MSKLIRTYSQAQIDSCRFKRQVTRNGVAYHWWLESPYGAGFMLCRESHHTDKEISTAKRQLRSQRDVWGDIAVATEEQL